VAFGPIDGVPVGSTFENRRALFEAGVHRQLQAGIAGPAREGAESIVLSGGYEDDADSGSEILYTGQGGRDAASGQQVHDQQLNRGNLALANSMRRGVPVRVIRGVSPDVHDPPPSGYRYDGLYRVTDFWPEVGQSGHRVWRFRLVPSDAPQPGRVEEQRASYEPAPRREEQVERLIRRAAVAESVKQLHGYRCQVCGERLGTPAGPYAEAAHIRPLGRPHNGPDVAENMLCLCPNHHVLLDQFALAIKDDLELIGFPGRLRTHSRHRIDPAHVRYHRDLFFAAAEDYSSNSAANSP
jgi:putative restriction endonuclease